MVIVPAIEGFRISLTDWDGIYSIPNFIGFDNYQRFLSDPDFFECLWTTLKMAVIVILAQNIVAIFTAIMLTRDRVVNTIARAVFFIPTLLTMIVVGLVFSYVFSPTFGPINLIAET